MSHEDLKYKADLYLLFREGLNETISLVLENIMNKECCFEQADESFPGFILSEFIYDPLIISQRVIIYDTTADKIFSI